MPKFAVILPAAGRSTRFGGMEKKPFVELLSLSASYRYSDYSTGTTSDTYGVGLEYAPRKSMKLRGSVQRAVRSLAVQADRKRSEAPSTLAAATAATTDASEDHLPMRWRQAAVANESKE